ncbi:hypothetical protein HY250_03785 [Candidatus Azambacteria bacterium]|nr:hypothetical protein [Candidatus Azambacteria bacterium]
MKTFASFVMVFALAIAFTGIALAQAPGGGIVPTGGVDANLLGQQGISNTTTLVGTIVGLVNWIAWFVGLIAVLAGLYAGILFITAGGNAETVTKARNILLYAIVGIVSLTCKLYQKVEALTTKTYMTKVLSFALVFAFAFSFAGLALAQAPGGGIVPTGGVDPNLLGQQGISNTTTLVNTILGLVNWLAWFVGLLAVIMGLWAGILFITAGGDAAKVSTARNILLYAIVGIAVAVLAFGIVAISRSLLNV